MLSLRKAFLALGLLSGISVAQAAIIEINADHFSVTYDDAQTGLYKQGLLSGSLDTVYFQPNTFKTSSAGSQVSTQSLLQLALTIDPGYTFAGLSFTEQGNYYLLGGGAVDVAASVQLVNPENSASVLLNLAPGVPLDKTLKSTPWELAGDLAPLGLGAPQTLLITLDNTLWASASVGLGYIQKTYVGFRVTTEAVSVPEPSSWALLLAGIMAALLVGNRRRVRASNHGRYL